MGRQDFREFRMLMEVKMSTFKNVTPQCVVGFWSYLSSFPYDIIKQAINIIVFSPETQYFPKPGRLYFECNKLTAKGKDPLQPIFCNFCSAVAPPRGEKCTCGVILEGLSDLTESTFDPNKPVLKELLKQRLERQDMGITQREYNIIKFGKSPKLKNIAKMLAESHKIN